MAKRKGKTEEERQERKRLKKEAKKRRRSQEQEVAPEPVVSSSFLKKKVELTVSLLPADLANVKKSVEQHLRRFLLKYADGVGGIMLAFDNVKVGSRGAILNELPYIHYAVSCDALVFAPKPDAALRGIVTESFHSHLSLIVHQYFNASISAEELRSAGFEFDEDAEQWYHNDAALTKDDSVEFVVGRVHESGGIISIDGGNPALITAAQ